MAEQDRNREAWRSSVWPSISCLTRAYQVFKPHLYDKEKKLALNRGRDGVVVMGHNKTETPESLWESLGRNYDRFGACMPLVEQTAGYTTVYTTMMNKPIYWVMLNLTDPVQKSSTGQSSHQTKIVAAQELAFPDDLKTILSKIKAMCAMLVGSGDVDDAEMEKHKDEVLALCSKYLEDLREDYEWEKVDGSLSDDWVEAECFSMRNG